MSAQHTPGRLKVQHPHAGERGWEIAFEPGLEQVCQDVTEANARRLVACWNACDGIETDHLERHGLPDFAQKISELQAKHEELLAERDALQARTATEFVEHQRELSTALNQRDELLAALRMVMACAGDIAAAPDSLLEMALDDRNEETRMQANAFLVARAAIAKVEGAS